MLKEKNLNKDHFDNWASTYDNSLVTKLFFGPVNSKMLGLISRVSLTANPGSVLDIGCGTGRLLRAAAGHWPAARLFGVDLSVEMIAQAQRLAPDISFQVAPAESIPIPDQTIDLALSSLSFHHWSDPRQGLGEIARVLRPGGWFCLADQTMPSWLAEQVHSGAKTRDKINALLSEKGLSIVRQEAMFGRFVWITLAQKTPIAKDKVAGD